MIDFDSEQNNDLQIVNGKFSISSGSNDPTAFFNMSPVNTNNQNNQSSSSNSIHMTGGFSSPNFFGSSNGNNQIVTPNPPPQTNNQGSQCSGNCGSCVWSFLCKKAVGKLSSIGGSAPKLV